MSEMDEKVPSDVLTLEQVQEKVNILEKYTRQLHQLIFDASYKDEVFRRLLIDKEPSLYDSFLRSLPAYQIFLNTLNQIRDIEKVSDKLKAIDKFNNGDSVFTMYVEDTNVIQTIAKVGELSLKTYKAILELPHTLSSEEALGAYLEQEDKEPSASAPKPIN
jgi:hypothetical protein